MPFVVINKTGRRAPLFFCGRSLPAVLVCVMVFAGWLQGIDAVAAGRADAVIESRQSLPNVGAETIKDARYADPVARYGHFALGRPHEYARLTVTTSTGRKLALQLPDHEVFEDLAPRRVSLAANEAEALLVIISRSDSGSRLALITLAGETLAISAQSPAIGTPMRWLNPVGAADLDGDGRQEIAAVITPHIGGMLKVYRQQGAALVEIAALAGFSNHQYGSTELALSMTMEIAGRMRLLVPDTTRQHLRIITLEGRRLVESGRCALPSTVTGAIKPMSPGTISISLGAVQEIVAPDDCMKQTGRGKR